MKTKIFLFLFIIGLIFCTTTLFSQEKVVRFRAGSELNESVKAVQNGEPVQGARVHLIRPQNLLPSRTKPVFLTDQNGEFVVQFLPKDSIKHTVMFEQLEFEIQHQKQYPINTNKVTIPWDNSFFGRKIRFQLKFVLSQDKTGNNRGAFVISPRMDSGKLEIISNVNRG